MDYKDKILFNKECEEAYKPLMQKLILEWRNKYDAATIRECFHFWICKHCHEKILDIVNRRKHRTLRYKLLKAELRDKEIEQHNNDMFKEV